MQAVNVLIWRKKVVQFISRINKSLRMFEKRYFPLEVYIKTLSCDLFSGGVVCRTQSSSLSSPPSHRFSSHPSGFLPLTKSHHASKSSTSCLFFLCIMFISSCAWAVSRHIHKCYMLIFRLDAIKKHIMSENVFHWSNDQLHVCEGKINQPRSRQHL